MPFNMFYSRFPREAVAETRSVILPKGHDGLPAGAYHFREMFCDEPGCDCRRVFFWVDRSSLDRPSPVSGEPDAVVAWGWEDVSFYRIPSIRYHNANPTTKRWKVLTDWTRFKAVGLWDRKAQAEY